MSYSPEISAPLNNRSRPARYRCWITAFLAGGKWVGALSLTAVSLFYSSSAAQNGWKFPLGTLFLLPLGSACLVGLFALDVWKGRATWPSSIPWVKAADVGLQLDD